MGQARPRQRRHHRLTPEKIRVRDDFPGRKSGSETIFPDGLAVWTGSPGKSSLTRISGNEWLAV
jgi:hypothetical protein